MPDQRVNILLAEEDSHLADMITRCLQDMLPASVTHTPSVGVALREELTARHHVVVASMSLPDADGLELVRELRVTNRCPVILMADNLSVEQTINAMRLGVTDLFCKPFDLHDLCQAVGRAATHELKRRRARIRYRRLRRLASQIVRERRDLRQRMDLICQDFVYAYRRLAQRVSESGLLTHD